MRKIAKVDALFVEGPDDGALVNALVKRLTGTELAQRPYLVRTSDQGPALHGRCASSRPTLARISRMHASA